MQAIALVTNDKFLLSYNISIDTSDVVEYIRKLDRPMHGRLFDSEFYFLEQFIVNLTEVFTHRGVCYDFNIVDSSKLFHLDRFADQLSK